MSVETAWPARYVAMQHKITMDLTNPNTRQGARFSHLYTPHAQHTVSLCGRPGNLHNGKQLSSTGERGLELRRPCCSLWYPAQ
eukprot:1149107-Pelagomonas_calceolata.AAC.4